MLHHRQHLTSPRTVTVKFILPEGSVLEAKAAKIQYQDPEKVLFLVFAWITKIKNKHSIGSFHRKIGGKKTIEAKQNVHFHNPPEIAL